MIIRKALIKFLKSEDGFFGGLISAGLGLASSIFGNKSQKQEVGAVNQGFNYLKGNENVMQAQDFGQQAGGLMAGLLGLGGDQEAAEEAFGTYRDSTGYNFRLDEGMRGIEGSRAARGILNSGATAKALTQFSQDFASNEFEKYLGQLGQQQATGLQSAFQVGSAGSAAGGAAASAIQRGTENKMSGLGGIVRGVSSIFGF